jgi:hypothetical protein
LSSKAFPLRFFVNGTKGYLEDGSMPSLDVETALGFFRENRMPEGFYRREGAYDNLQLGDDIVWMIERHPVSPGKNEGLGNYVVDDTPLTLCAIYRDQIRLTLKQYPPTEVKGRLRKAVKANLKTFYDTLPPDESKSCEELLPYGP